MESEFAITLSAQAAEDLIPCLESRINALNERIMENREEIERLNNENQAHAAQRDSTKITLAELKAKLDGKKPVIKNGKFQKRLPQGYGDKLIAELLASLPPGEGLTMAEIEEKTGVNHATVFRTFKQARRNNGRFASKKGKWMLKASGQTPPDSVPTEIGERVLASESCRGCGASVSDSKSDDGK